MTAVGTLPLEQKWKDRLGLSDRRAPEFYETADAVVDAPHALALRTAFEDLQVTAVFCVQGVPTVVFLAIEQYEQQRVIDLHAALWNQGLASLLLVLCGDTLRAYSLAKKPYKDRNEEFDNRCLVTLLDNTTEVLKFRNLIDGAESGRLWTEHTDYFNPNERIDHVLLENLTDSHEKLCKANLSPDAAQALLIQAMFIAYLEDRGIIKEDYFREASRDAVESFSALLASSNNLKLVSRLFNKLRKDFNGDLFVAPCSFEPRAKTPAITPVHLEVLARFRDGREEMGKGGQLLFWGYNFRFIPIELVSAVYDRFLGEREDERREQGAYYTPMFLADTVVSQVWDLLSSDIREKGRFLDPACGSGVFLVRSFQRLCEHWRATRKQKTIRWPSLLTILERVNGWDLNGSAVRVAVFSLYVALLEEVSPPELRLLIKDGKILPELWGKTLRCGDFFDVPESQNTFDVVIGNPPWTSRRGPNRASVRWCAKNALPMPGKEDAWAFAWKALRHVTPSGIIAFLFPAMGFLHNHAAKTVEARNKLIRESAIRRIVNFADLRFQLFENAQRPAALFIFGQGAKPGPAYRFDYWAPKADLNLRIKRVITLSSADKLSLSSDTVTDNPLAFKNRLWMREPDAKLFSYLSKLPMLGSFVKDYSGVRRRKQDLVGQWIIGQGYQPHHEPKEGKRPSPYSMSQYVGKIPDLPIIAFQRLAQTSTDLKPATSSRVRRKGFEAGFKGTRVLIPRGVDTVRNRLRATYVETPLTFQHIIQSIIVPSGQEYRAKLLTAVLNSKVAIWFAFHGTSSFGADRPEVQQAELLHLPFPAADNLPDPKRAKKAADKLVALVDGALAAAQTPAALIPDEDDTLDDIDDLSYDYFCLSANEISLVEDTVSKIIPAVQPHEGGYPDLWKQPNPDEREDYATTLEKSVAAWLDNGSTVTAELEAKSADLGILRLSLDGPNSGRGYSERQDGSISEALKRLAVHFHQPLDGNFQLMPDFRAFVGANLYLIKPMQRRFWLKSAALADANAIAMDLQDAVELDTRRSSA